MMKLLISAYACSPVRGSESGMGWGFVKSISEHHDLWVITEEEKFKPEIEAELKKQPELKERIKFYYIPKTRHKTLRKIWPPSYYWFYKAWQKRAYELALSLHKEVGFDLIHQLNMVGFREPGYLWKLDVPFVWGPIGGMGILPWRFLPTLGPYGFFYYLGKNTINLFQMRFLRRPQKAALKACALIAATPDTGRAIKKLWNRDCEIICEVGPPGQIVRTHSTRANHDPLKLVWAALHIPQKALNLLLQALASVSGDVQWQLSILGAGPRTKAWKRLAHKLRVADMCCWHGWVPRKDAISMMQQGHVFIISSLLDLTSSGTLDALSAGLPIICLDHCGFADIVTDECGIRIPVNNPRQVAIGFATAIERLWHYESYRQNLASGAIRRAQQYSWEKKAESVNGVYERAVTSYRKVNLSESVYSP